MATRKKKPSSVIKEIEVKEELVPSKPKADIKFYPLKVRLKTSEGWKEVGEKIGLTKDAYEAFKFKKIV